jgi:glycine cleavage system aminomethyltransferase T
MYDSNVDQILDDRKPKGVGGFFESLYSGVVNFGSNAFGQGNAVGEVTSGLLSPTLDKPIALAYVKASASSVGSKINAVVRGKLVPMEVCPTPFIPPRYFRG